MCDCPFCTTDPLDLSSRIALPIIVRRRHRWAWVTHFGDGRICAVTPHQREGDFVYHMDFVTATRALEKEDELNLWVANTLSGEVTLSDLAGAHFLRSVSLPNWVGHTDCRRPWTLVELKRPPPLAQPPMKLVKRRKHASPSMVPITPHAAARPYDPEAIGGTCQANELAREPSRFWTEELLNELLRENATPPLVKAEFSPPHQYVCTFVRPDGGLVENVRCNRSLLLLSYKVE